MASPQQLNGLCDDHTTRIFLPTYRKYSARCTATSRYHLYGNLPA